MQGRFGKIVLVVLGVILMIVFILPAGIQSMGGGNTTVGTLDGEKVSVEEVRNADSLYQYARQKIRVPVGQGQEVPLPAAIFGEYAAILEEDPQLFYLLLREARENGATMPPEPLDELLAELNPSVMVRDPAATGGERPVLYEDIVGDQTREDVREVVGALLAVNRSFRQFADYPRISQPVLDYFMATQAQRVDLKTVVFDSERFLDQVQPPSEQALQEQFDQYKDNLAGSVTDDNPFGFGYRLPDAVKFQYLTVSTDAARRQLLQELAAMPLQERERALYRYWSENRARFPVPPGSPATQPSTQPSTQPTAQPADAARADPPATQPTTAPTTGPTTGPAAGDALLSAKDNPEVAAFLEAQTAAITGKPNEGDWRAYLAVHDNVASFYLAGRAAELKANVAKRIREMLATDFRAFDLARGAAGGSDTAAQTRVGVPVNDLAYLDRVADRIAEEFKIRPSVASYASEFFGHDELEGPADVGPIASAIAPDLQGMQFADYILHGTLPLLEGAVREQIEQSGNGLTLYKPSQPLIDLAGNEFVFRVIEARPDAPPASLAEVEEQVREDLRKRAAYELALEKARDFAEQARRTSLEAAAASAGLTVHDPAPFIPNAGLLDATAFSPTAEGATVSPAARADLVQSIYAMLSDPAMADQEQPIDVLPMRPAFRAVVAQLQELEGGWGNEMMLGMQREQLRRQLEEQSLMVAGPGADFYDFHRAAARVGFVPTTPRPKEGEDGADGEEGETEQP